MSTLFTFHPGRIPPQTLQQFCVIAKDSSPGSRPYPGPGGGVGEAPAARALNLASSVTRTIDAPGATAGDPLLFKRSTCQLVLTEQGSTFSPASPPLLEEADQLVQSSQPCRWRRRGPLRVSVFERASACSLAGAPSAGLSGPLSRVRLEIELDKLPGGSGRRKRGTWRCA